MTSTLRTARLLLERYVPEDEDSFVALFQDTRVSRWLGDGPSSEEDDRALFGRVAYGFDTLGLSEVHTTVAAANEASLALLGKLGFTHVRDITEDDGSTTRVLTRRR